MLVARCECVAVRLGPDGGVDADIAAASRPVLDDERTAERLLQRWRDETRRQVGGAAGRIGDDDMDGAVGRPGRERAADAADERRGDRAAGQSSGEFQHVSAPDLVMGPRQFGRQFLGHFPSVWRLARLRPLHRRCRRHAPASCESVAITKPREGRGGLSGISRHSGFALRPGMTTAGSMTQLNQANLKQR